MSEATTKFTPDPYKSFSEKLNGRAAMLGLGIGLAVEALTGKGIIEQVATFNQASALDLSGIKGLLGVMFSCVGIFS
tara:strand:- start:2189 stop:2419 length:231 start_codon:yes stop_codon:yes gene_type:complete